MKRLDDGCCCICSIYNITTLMLTVADGVGTEPRTKTISNCSLSYFPDQITVETAIETTSSRLFLLKSLLLSRLRNRQTPSTPAPAERRRDIGLVSKRTTGSSTCRECLMGAPVQECTKKYLDQILFGVKFDQHIVNIGTIEGHILRTA